MKKLYVLFVLIGLLILLNCCVQKNHDLDDSSPVPAALNVGTPEFSLPPGIDLFQYSASASGNFNMYEYPSARIWGWSTDGKAAISVERNEDGRGGKIINFFIIDLITDNIDFELKIDSFDHECYFANYSFEDLFKTYNPTISSALRSNNIISEQRNDFLSFPFRKNDITFNGQIIDLGYVEDEFGMFEEAVTRYSILLTAENRKKVIASFTPVSSVTGFIYVCGYFLSPFEDRIMIITAEEAFGYEGTRLNFRFNGFHLEVDF